MPINKQVAIECLQLITGTIPGYCVSGDTLTALSPFLPNFFDIDDDRDGTYLIEAAEELIATLLVGEKDSGRIQDPA